MARFLIIGFCGALIVFGFIVLLLAAARLWQDEDPGNRWNDGPGQGWFGFFHSTAGGAIACLIGASALEQIFPGILPYIGGTFVATAALALVAVMGS